MTNREEDNWGRQLQSQMVGWLQNPKVSYFGLRSYLSPSDLGLRFLLAKNYRFAKVKFAALGRCKGEILMNDHQVPLKSNSYAMVITFNPSIEVLHNLLLLAAQFENLIIVDNTPKPYENFFTDLILFKNCKVTLLQNHNVKGLAGGINLALRYVYGITHSGWVFFFDQDTLINPDFLDAIGNTLDHLSPRQRANSLFGVNYKDGRLGRKQKQHEYKVVRTVITSGSFMRVENLTRLGLYIDELYIDSLDHDYCLRAGRMGMEVLWLTRELMTHSLGEIQARQFLWKKDVQVTNHAPFRWYFFSRNFVFVFLEGFPWTLPWFFEHGFSLCKNFFKMLLFETHKIQKVLKFGKGIMDGVLLFVK